MKRVFRGILYILLAAVLMMTFLPKGAYAATNVRLIVNDYEVVGLASPPIMLQNRVMVPARAVFEEQLGGTVAWNSQDRQVAVFYGDDVLVMTINETRAWLNGTRVEIDTPPIILNNHTLIPLRVAEILGFDVSWNRSERAAIIQSPPDKSEPYAPAHTPEPTPYPTSDFAQDPESDFYPYPTGTPFPTPYPTGMPFPTPYPTATPHPTPVPDAEPAATPRPSGSARDVSSAPILPAPNPGTTITSILTPRETNADAYVIIASSAITDVNHFMLPDNRLVVDIYNATTSVTGPIRAMGPVYEARVGQFSRTPNVTRVVFELEGAVEYSVALSYDRDRLTVAFEANSISQITTDSSSSRDTFVVRGDFQPSVRVSSSGYPRYLTIYLDNASMDVFGRDMPGGAFASRFVVGQNGGAGYIRIYIQDHWPAVSLTHGDNLVSIALHRGLSGVRYDPQTRQLRLSRDVVSMDVNQIRYRENYLAGRYTFTLPTGTTDVGLGTLNVSDGYIRSIDVQQDEYGNTRIVFSTSRVMTFILTETSDYYIITAHLPQEIFPFIVVIDPGHGGRDPGAVQHGIREADLVLTISHMVMEYLNENPNIRAYMTRHTDVTTANSWRAAFANQMADLYVSIHANAVNNRPTVNGIETWYANHSREEALGMSSRRLARNIQGRMIYATGANDRGIRSNPNFVVLRDTHMPAALVEVGFLTNRDEAARLSSATHQRRLARAIYEGIVATFEAYQPPR